MSANTVSKRHKERKHIRISGGYRAQREWLSDWQDAIVQQQYISAWGLAQWRAVLLNAHACWRHIGLPCQRVSVSFKGAYMDMEGIFGIFWPHFDCWDGSLYGLPSPQKISERVFYFPRWISSSWSRHIFVGRIVHAMCDRDIIWFEWSFGGGYGVWDAILWR